MMQARRSYSIAAFIVLAGFASPTTADTPFPAVWDHEFGDALDQSVTAVTTDPSSAVYTLVNLAGTVNFGCGPITSAGSVDVALAKYNSSGACLWSKRFGDASLQTGVAASANATGIFIASTFSGSINAGGGNLTSLGGSDILVAHFDSNGAAVWSVAGGGTSADFATGLALDSAGNSLVIGYTAGTFAMGSVGLTSVGGNDGFVIQLNSTGSPQWLHAFSGAGEQQPHGVASDSSNNVIVTGLYAQSMDLGTGQLMSQGMNDIFLAKFDSSGNTVWAESFGAAGNDIGYAVTVDSADDIWMCGSYSGTVSFGSTTLTSHAASDNFVVRLDSTGHVLWAVDPYTGTGTGVTSVCSVAVNGDGRGYVGLSLSGTGTAFGAPFASAGSASNQSDAVVGAIRSTDGAPLGYFSAGSTEQAKAFSVAIDPGGRILSGGYFYGNINFGLDSLNSSGGQDGYVVVQIDDRIYIGGFE